MKPACYGSYSANPQQPCGSCAWRGKCAAAADLGPFAVLNHPRCAATRERVVVRPVEMADLEATRVGLEAAGFEVSKTGNVRPHRKLRRVAKIGIVGRLIAVTFPNPLHRIAGLPGAENVDLRHHMVKADTATVRTRIGKGRYRSRTVTVRTSRDLRIEGCVAICPDAVTAVRLLVEVVKDVSR